MKIVAFGGNGQLAFELGRRGIPLIDRSVADFEQPESVERAVRDCGADVILNAAAYTAVDRAESEVDRAMLINATSVGAMARVAADLGIAFVHVSTDYVFDGEGTAPFRPDDETDPLGAYGRSKRAGEIEVQAAGGSHAILRTSWVFSSHGANFVKTMLRLSGEREVLRIVSDQIGGPTPAADLAQACLTVGAALRGDPARSGIYHYSGAPETSWADFAREIFRRAGRETRVEDIPTSEYPTPARRPLNGRLDCSTTAEVFGLERPDWRVGLDRVLGECGFPVTDN